MLKNTEDFHTSASNETSKSTIISLIKKSNVFQPITSGDLTKAILTRAKPFLIATPLMFFISNNIHTLHYKYSESFIADIVFSTAQSATYIAGFAAFVTAGILAFRTSRLSKDLKSPNASLFDDLPFKDNYTNRDLLTLSKLTSSCKLNANTFTEAFGSILSEDEKNNIESIFKENADSASKTKIKEQTANTAAFFTALKKVSK